MKTKEYFDLYFNYISSTESSSLYHRWSAISILSSAIGNKISIPMGHFKLKANFYIQFIGKPASRKSSAINIASKLRKKADIIKIAPSTTSLEGLLLELSKTTDKDGWENSKTGLDPASMAIMADEFNMYCGDNPRKLLIVLSSMWDCPEEFKLAVKLNFYPKIEKPFVNILSGNTQSSFINIFGSDLLGQGILSRMIFVPVDTIKQKCAFPKKLSTEKESMIISVLKKLGALPKSEIKYSDEATEFITRIYNKVNVDLPPFLQGYAGRRHIHLLKLCSVFACLNGLDNGELIITLEIAREANTYLAITEILMKKNMTDLLSSQEDSALKVAIIQIISANKTPTTIGEIYAKTNSKVKNITALMPILEQMKGQDLIVLTDSGAYMEKKIKTNTDQLEFIDLSHLTQDELSLI